MIALEKQVRQAIREAVNHNSRKPFHWGGLSGYQQLEAIAQALESLREAVDETGYFKRLLSQVNRALVKNRKEARNLAEAHQWLCQIAGCLHYPPKDPCTTNFNSTQVTNDMEALLQSFTPNPKAQFPRHVYIRLCSNAGVSTSKNCWRVTMSRACLKIICRWKPCLNNYAVAKGVSADASLLANSVTLDKRKFSFLPRAKLFCWSTSGTSVWMIIALDWQGSLRLSNHAGLCNHCIMIQNVPSLDWLRNI